MDTQQDPGAGNSPDGPACYRHPGRETYLSCVRCGRPACPECLKPAPVGHQCVDCIKAGNTNVRRPVTIAGGRVTSDSMVTWVLVGLNVACYLAEWIYPRIENYLWMIGRAYDPTIHQLTGVAAGQYYRLLTSAFLHEEGLTGLGPAHIIFNMYALIILGPPVERALGRARYLTVYLLSALGGSVLFYLIGSPLGSALGASGAIFGLFGALFVVARKLRIDLRPIVVVIGINLALPFFIHAIAWQAHVGGLITGGLITAAYTYAPRDRRTLIQVGATVLLIALFVVIVVIRTHQIVAAGL